MVVRTIPTDGLARHPECMHACVDDLLPDGGHPPELGSKFMTIYCIGSSPHLFPEDCLDSYPLTNTSRVLPIALGRCCGGTFQTERTSSVVICRWPLRPAVPRSNVPKPALATGFGSRPSARTLPHPSKTSFHVGAPLERCIADPESPTAALDQLQHVLVAEPAHQCDTHRELRQQFALTGVLKPRRAIDISSKLGTPYGRLISPK